MGEFRGKARRGGQSVLFASGDETPLDAVFSGGYPDYDRCDQQSGGGLLLLRRSAGKVVGREQERGFAPPRRPGQYELFRRPCEVGVEKRVEGRLSFQRGCDQLRPAADL